MSPRLRFVLWILIVFLLLCGQLSWLFLMRGPRILDSDALLVGGQGLLTLAILIVALLLKTTPRDAIKLRRRTSEWIILGGVALLQLAAVALLRPALSEDVLRYRVDGRMWLEGVSPYATAPRDWDNAGRVDRLVPFPEMRTIYPAVSQATFVTGAAIERAIGRPIEVPAPLPPSAVEQSPWRHYMKTAASPYRANVFRVMYAAAAVAAAYVLLLLLHTADQSPWWAVIAAWNPLLTLEAGGMGHQDIVGVCLVLLCLHALAKQRSLLAVTSLALAAGVKPFAFFIAPFVIRDTHNRRRVACAFALVLALLYLPPLLIQRGYSGWRDTARTYSRTWEANGSFYDVIVRTFGDGDEGRANERAKQMARLIGAAAIVATALAAWQFRAAPAAAGYWLCLIALLVSPVAYPWYLLWALCFVPLLRGEAGWTAIVWAGTIGLSYTMWHQPTWRMSGAALLAEYGVVYAALAVEVGVAIRRARAIAIVVTDDAPATSGSRPFLSPPRPL
jgi:hypothetical protein